MANLGIWSVGVATNGEESSLSEETSAPAISGTYECGTKTYCSEMESCEEAEYFLNTCGLDRLDADGDGIPCESLCVSQ